MTRLSPRAWPMSAARRPSRRGFTPGVDAMERRQLMTAGVPPLVSLTAHDTSNIVAGSDGNLYLGVESAARTATIDRISPSGAVTPIPITTSEPAVSVDIPSLATGPDGNIWFAANVFTATTEEVVIGNVTPAGQVTEFPALTGTNGLSSSVVAIVDGPDNDLWFSYQTSNLLQPGVSTAATTVQDFIGQITTAGAVTLHPISPPGISFLSNGGGAFLVAGADGNLWFTQGNDGLLGRMTPSGAVTTFPIGDNLQGATLTNGPAGNFLIDAVTAGSLHVQILSADTSGAVRPYKLAGTKGLPGTFTLGTVAGEAAFQRDGNAPSLILSPRSGAQTTVNLAARTHDPIGWQESATTGPDGSGYLVAQNGTILHGANTLIYRITPAQLAGKAAPRTHAHR